MTLENLLDEVLGAESEARDAIIRRVRQQRNRDKDQATDERARTSLTDSQTARDAQDESDDEDSDKEECDAVRDMTSLLAHLDVDETGVVYSVGASSNATRKEPVTKISDAEEALAARACSGSPAPQFRMSPFAVEGLVGPTYLTPCLLYTSPSPRD